MKNLIYLEKIIDKDIKKANERNAKSQFPFIKNMRHEFKNGEIFLLSTSKTCEDLFYLLFDKEKFTYHSAMIENDHIALVGYSIDISKNITMSPVANVDDYGAICKCSFYINHKFENNVERKQKIKEATKTEKNKIRKYIYAALKNEDKKAYINLIKCENKNNNIE